MDAIKELILATSNAGKIKELNSLLSPIYCIPQGVLAIPDAEETGLSFIENAIIKARHASYYGKKPALADDSGLVVPVLQGEPGIFSARYAGLEANDKSNMMLLLDRMTGISQEQRKAYFYCAIALIQHENDPTPLVATGIFHGRIATSLAGNNGFGYDPIFYLDDHQCTAAQLSANIKNKISHRAKALAQLNQLIVKE